MTWRLTIDPGGDLPTLLQVKTGRLKVECGQHRAGTAAPPCFFLCHHEDPAAKPAAPQILWQEKRIDPQKPERCSAQQAADNLLGFRISGENSERTSIPTSRLLLVVGAQPVRDYRALVIVRCIGQRDRGFGFIGHDVSSPPVVITGLDLVKPGNDDV
jgi:hypothetical protein